MKLTNVAVMAVVLCIAGSGGALLISEQDYFDIFHDDGVSIDVDGTVGTVNGGGKYTKGDTVTLKAVAPSGYQFKEWKENGRSISTNDTLTFIAENNRHISAEFIKIHQIRLSAEGKGLNGYGGAGAYLDKDTVNLTANLKPGYRAEWYSGNVLLSSGNTYSFTATSDLSIVLKAKVIYDASFTWTKSASVVPITLTLIPSVTAEVQSSTWVIKDTFSGDTLFAYGSDGYRPAFADPKALTITHTVIYEDGHKEVRTENTIVNGKVNMSYTWSYFYTKTYDLFGHRIGIPMVGTHTISYNLDFERYATYRLSDVAIKTGLNTSKGMQNKATLLTTYDDPYIMSLANYINNLTRDMNDTDRVSCALSFVQSLNYTSDPNSRGYPDYWKYAYETLFDHGGDCDDMAILFVSIVEAMGYDAVLFCVPGHLATGVHVDDCNGKYYTYKGIKYYLADPTNNHLSGQLAYNLGDGRDDWSASDVTQVLAVGR